MRLWVRVARVPGIRVRAFPPTGGRVRPKATLNTGSGLGLEVRLVRVTGVIGVTELIGVTEPIGVRLGCWRLGFLGLGLGPFLLQAAESGYRQPLTLVPESRVWPRWAVREGRWGGQLSAHSHYSCMTEGAERGHLISPCLGPF